MDLSVTLDLPADITSPGRARQLVAAILHNCRLDSLVPYAKLLVSEIVTEAVLHTPTAIELNAAGDDQTIIVRVRADTPDEFFVDPFATYRRRALDEFADQWASEHTDGTRVIWFAMTKPPNSPNQPDRSAVVTPDHDHLGHASIRTTSDRDGHLYDAARDRTRERLEHSFTDGAGTESATA